MHWLSAARRNSAAAVLAAILSGAVPGAQAQTGPSALEALTSGDMADVDAFLDRLLADGAADPAAPADAPTDPVAPARLDCVMRPSADVALSAPEPGLLAEVSVSRGERVAAGQVVARLEDGVEAATVALDTARSGARVARAAREAEAAMAMRQAERARQLQARGLLPEDEVEAALTAEEVARFAVDLIDEDSDLRRLELARSEAALERRRIRSPIDGIVLEQGLAAGEYADAQSPILRIVTLDPLHVETFAPASAFGTLSPGDGATVWPVPPLGGQHRALVQVVDPVFDAAGGVFGVRLLLDNPGARLPAGYRCAVAFDARRDDVAAPSVDAAAD